MHISVRHSTHVPQVVQGLLTKAAVKKGAIVHGAIFRLTAHGALFESEEREVPLDDVILATGYQYCFPFLPRELGGSSLVRQLYKRVFHADDPTLAFVGLQNTLFPPWIVFEFQARWIAAVLAGRARLPSTEEMQREAWAHAANSAPGAPAAGTLHLKTPRYCNELSSLSGEWWRGYWVIFFVSKWWRIVLSMLLQFVWRRFHWRSPTQHR